MVGKKESRELTIKDSVFDNSNQAERIPPIKRQFLWRINPSETNSPDKKTTCLRKLRFFIFFSFISTSNQKTSIKWKKKNDLCTAIVVWELKVLVRRHAWQYSPTNTSRDLGFLATKPQFQI